jgi:hypothetical protein
MEKRERVNEFAIKFLDEFNKTDITKERLEELKFPDECWNMGFGTDGGRKFIVSCPGYDVFGSVTDLKKALEEINDPSLMGSALLPQWETMAEFNEDIRQWYVAALEHLKYLTDDIEPMTVQELSAMLKENKEQLLSETEVAPWDLECWINDPMQIVNMDSGIAYDVARVLGITVDDIIEAVEIEEMYYSIM